MSYRGYYRYPAIHRSKVYFVCEDDLWMVEAAGGLAVRLTANPGRISHPRVSPDGRKIAITSRDEGHPEIYVMDITGGKLTRLTFLGGNTLTVGWTPQGDRVIYTTNAGSPFAGLYTLGTVPVAGGLHKMLPWGQANAIAFGPKGEVVLGRHTWDPARWKRYRGGKVGRLWIDIKGDGTFKPLLELDGNLTAPMWIGSRIYFGSDHEGVCNLYSCRPNGKDLRRHTFHEEFYIRYPSTDGRRIVYQCGADLYIYDPRRKESRLLDITVCSPRPESARKFVVPAKYLEDYDLHPQGHTLAVTVRGKPYVFPNWERSVSQLGQPDGVRYRLCRWLGTGDKVICVSDRLGEEHLEIYTPHDKSEEAATVRPDYDLGRLLCLECSRDGKLAAASNHRYEVILVDLESEQITLVDRSEYERIAGLCFSPDSKWLAYSIAVNRQAYVIRLYSITTGKHYDLTRPEFADVSPSFDPDGRYLYFLSYRDFNPVYDNLFFDLNFPKCMRPYLILLQKDLPDPFQPEPRPPGENSGRGDSKASVSGDSEGNQKQEDKPGEEGSDDTQPDSDSKATLHIDLEGIEDRVLAFPLPEGKYGRLAGIKGKLLYTTFPVVGTHDDGDDNNGDLGTLHFYDFDKLESTEMAGKVNEFRLSADGKALIYRSKNQLRVIPAHKKPDHNDTKPGRKSGYIDLNRIKVSVSPPLEWRQMFREAWRLMRDHFWRADMGGVDWSAMYERYLPLLDKVATRSEFSDLLWELQGELGTSHAYESGGDYRPAPWYPLGKLACTFEYDEQADSYRIAHIARGDTWNPKENSPLNHPPYQLQEGDLLLEIDGRRLSKQVTPGELLVNKGGLDLELTILPVEAETPKKVYIKALSVETPAWYRHWVNSNRRLVHSKSGNKVGYIHIPNMGSWGYAEFHRSYYSELEREALIIDVRYNGGGHVSQLVLEKLARRRLGYDFNRWGKPIPYPQESPKGPLVALINEVAGSDGDIFAHSFKQMGLGPLIGKRTWGGVIGIWPRHKLVDGTQTTQPEFAYWSQDIGWRLENYGTEPDFEVDIRPQDWANGLDPQLNKAIEIAMELLSQQEDKDDSGGSPLCID